MRSVFRKLSGKEDGDQDDNRVATTKEKEGDDTKPPRSKDGKFRSRAEGTSEDDESESAKEVAAKGKPTEPAKKAEKPAKDKAEGEEGDDEEEAEKAEKPAKPSSLRPPVSISREAKEAWDKLPEPVQRDIVRREREATSKIGDLSKQVKELSVWSDILKDNDDVIKETKVAAPELVRNLLSWQAFMLKDAPAALTQMAKVLGVKATIETPEGSEVSPEISALKAQVQALNKQIERMTATPSQKEAEKPEAREEEADGDDFEARIEAVLEDLPDVDQLIDELDAELKAIRKDKPNLPPEAAVLLAHQRASRKAQDKAREASRNQTQEKKAAAENAKKVVSLTVKPEPSPSQPANEEDAMRAAYRRAMKS